MLYKIIIYSVFLFLFIYLSRKKEKNIFNTRFIAVLTFRYTLYKRCEKSQFRIRISCVILLHPDLINLNPLIGKFGLDTLLICPIYVAAGLTPASLVISLRNAVPSLDNKSRFAFCSSRCDSVGLSRWPFALITR